MKRKLLPYLFLLIAAMAAAETPATYKQWGDQLYQAIYSKLRHPSYTYLYREKTGSSPAYCWPMGIQLKGLIYAGKLTEAEGLYQEFHTHYYANARGYEAYNAVIHGTDDRYYDDNAWIAKDLMDLYDKTGKTLYLDRAKMVMKFCMSGERPAGGIHFHEGDGEPTSERFNKWSTCATAPTCVTNLRLFQATAEQKYFDDGKRLYDFMKTDVWGIGYGYRGYENAVVMQAALYMYEITGQQVYLSDAQQLAYSMDATYISWESKRLNEYGCWGGHDMTDAYVHLNKIDKNPHWLSIVDGYLSFLRNQCKDANGFYPEEWDDTSKNTSKTIGLLEQASAMAAFYLMATVGAEPRAYDPVAVFKLSDYNKTREGGNFKIGLNPGSYTKKDLIFMGHTNNRFVFSPQISSLVVNPGYQITLYSQDNFMGDSAVFTKDTPFLAAWDDKTVSLKVTDASSVEVSDAGFVFISSYEELDAIRNNRILDATDNRYKITGNYYLTTDIVMPDGVEWIPIGSTSVSDNNPAAFNGIFDGRGHSIRNLNTGTSGNYPLKGFFARLCGATVRNLNLVNVNIKGSSPVGGVTGAMYGGTTIERVSVTGSIEASGVLVGGIAGYCMQDKSSIYNFVSDCYVDASIKTAYSNAGGILGQLQTASTGTYSKLRIQNVYVKGRIEAKTTTAGNNAAGIVAVVQSSDFQLAHAVVACDSIIGGTPNYYFSRDKTPGFFYNNHVRNDLKLTYCDELDKGKGSETTYQVGKNTYATFTTQHFYEDSLGWDFQNVWTMTEGGFPIFKALPVLSVRKIKSGVNACDVLSGQGFALLLPLKPTAVSVYDLSGRLIATKTVETSTSLPLPKGIYLIRLVSEQQDETRKVLVK